MPPRKPFASTATAATDENPFVEKHDIQALTQTARGLGMTCVRLESAITRLAVAVERQNELQAAATQPQQPSGDPAPKET